MILAALCLAAVVTISPLLYGGVLPRERLLVEAASFWALLLLLIARRDTGAFKSLVLPSLALLAVAAFGLLQAQRIWPHSYSPPVSLAVARTWAAAAAALVAAGVIGAHRPFRRGLALVFMATTVFEIAYGAERWFSASPEIWGRPTESTDRLRGTFVNPDHFAMYLILALAIAFAWVWWAARRLSRREIGLERRLLEITVPASIFLMFFVGLAFTGSRAGFAGALMALVVQTLVLAVSRRRWQAALPGLGMLGAGLLGLAYFGWQQGMRRWLETSAYDVTWSSRLEVWRHSLELWSRHPLTGTGLGTFRQAFSEVQPPDLGLTWFHAHSDVLELLVTTGLVGVIPMALALALVLRRLWNVLCRGRRSEDRAAALAAVGALAGVLVHAGLDFGLTLPANAFLLLILLGLACGARATAPESAGS